MTKTEAAELVALRKESAALRKDIAKLISAVAKITPSARVTHHIAEAPKPRPADGTYVFPGGANADTRARVAGLA